MGDFGVATLRHMWKPLALLSIIVPVSLLVTFRLSGILEQPAEPERITLEPIAVTISRPSETLERINKSTQNEWKQEKASVSACIHIYDYLGGAEMAPFLGRDGLTFKTYINASFVQGRIITIKINFRPLDANSLLLISQERWNHPENATVSTLHYWGTNETDAFIKFNVMNSSCTTSDQLFWIFLDENSESHELQITAEVLHTDRNTAKIITIPIKLKITASEDD